MGIYVYMYTCAMMCIYVYIHVDIWVYTCICIHVHICVYTCIIYIYIYIYTHFEDIITSFNHLCSRNCNEHGKKLHHDVENIKFPRSNKSMVIYSRTSHRFTIDAFTDALQMQVISLRISVTRCKIYYS